MAQPKLNVVPNGILKIETDVPLAGLTRSPLIQAFRELAVAPIGASFFIPPEVCSVGGQITERAVRVGGRGWVAVRKQPGGYRAWKIAEPAPR
jgi:hypothetical protein